MQLYLRKRIELFFYLLLITFINFSLAQEENSTCVLNPWITVNHTENNHFEEGFPFTLKCHTAIECPESNYTVEWQTPANTTKGMEITTFQNGNWLVSTLRVENASVEQHNGSYSCLIEDGEELREEEIDITIECCPMKEEYMIKIDKSKIRFESKEGEDFQWNLGIYAFPPKIKYTFYKDNQVLNLTGIKYSAIFDYEMGELNFTVNSLELEDVGNYTVKVESYDASVHDNFTMQLLVQENSTCVTKPWFTVNNTQNSHFQEGFPFKLKCHAAIECPGSNYTVEWQTPANTTEGMEITTFRNGSWLVSILRVENASVEQHNGSYSCFIEDGKELKEEEIDITIDCCPMKEDYKIEIDKSKIWFESKEGEDFHWNLSISAFLPKIKYTFYKDNQVLNLTGIKYSALFNYEMGQLDFTINSLMLEDFGNYTVKVENLDESVHDNFTMQLLVQDNQPCILKPWFTVNHIRNNHFREGFPFSLKCHAAIDCPESNYTVKWQTPANTTKGMEISTFQTSSWVVSTLRVEKASVEKHNGSFGCFIEDGGELRGEEINITIDCCPMKEDYKIEIDKSKIWFESKEGQDFQWNLGIYAFPPKIKYTFYKDNKIINLTGLKYSALFDYEMGELNFTINSLLLEDFGNYTVKVETYDESVHDSLTMQLLVEGQPKFDSRFWPVAEAHDDRPITLSTKILAPHYTKHRENLKIYWSFNKINNCMQEADKLNNFTVRTSGALNENIVTSVTFTAKTTGFVICHVENEHGKSCHCALEISIIHKSKTQYVVVGLVLGFLVLLIALHIFHTQKPRSRKGFEPIKYEEMRTLRTNATEN